MVTQRKRAGSFSRSLKYIMRYKQPPCREKLHEKKGLDKSRKHRNLLKVHKAHLIRKGFLFSRLQRGSKSRQYAQGMTI